MHVPFARAVCVPGPGWWALAKLNSCCGGPAQVNTECARGWLDSHSHRARACVRAGCLQGGWPQRNCLQRPLRADRAAACAGAAGCRAGGIRRVCCQVLWGAAQRVPTALRRRDGLASMASMASAPALARAALPASRVCAPGRGRAGQSHGTNNTHTRARAREASSAKLSARGGQAY